MVTINWILHADKCRSFFKIRWFSQIQSLFLRLCIRVVPSFIMIKEYFNFWKLKSYNGFCLWIIFTLTITSAILLILYNTIYRFMCILNMRKIWCACIYSFFIHFRNIWTIIYLFISDNTCCYYVHTFCWMDSSSQ